MSPTIRSGTGARDGERFGLCRHSPWRAVAIALPNGLPAIVSFLAASIAGKAAPLNPAYPYEEFHFFLGDTDARILICPSVGAEFARTAAADRKIPCSRWK